MDARIKKIGEATSLRADGVVLVKKHFLDHTTPSAPIKGSYRDFSWCRGHPSSAEEGNALLYPFCVSPL